jgi:hypothetical protein
MKTSRLLLALISLSVLTGCPKKDGSGNDAARTGSRENIDAAGHGAWGNVSLSDAIADHDAPRPEPPKQDHDNKPERGGGHVEKGGGGHPHCH